MNLRLDHIWLAYIDYLYKTLPLTWLTDRFQRFVDALVHLMHLNLIQSVINIQKAQGEIDNINEQLNFLPWPMLTWFWLLDTWGYDFNLMQTQANSKFQLTLILADFQVRCRIWNWDVCIAVGLRWVYLHVLDPIEDGLST